MRRLSLALIAPLFIIPAAIAQPAPTQIQPAAVPAQPATTAAQPATDAPAKPKKPDLYDETADAKQQIAAALDRARKNNRRVLIQWGADWCGWCHLLHNKVSTDAALKKELQYEYDVVHVDIGQWDKNMDLAAAYGAELKKNGVPFLTVLDADGKPIANQETGSLEAKQEGGENGHDAAKVMEFLKKHAAPARSADEALSAAIAQAKSEDKIVFLHFGAPWCGWCHRLEDWMATEQVAAILGKDFIDLKIDTDRDTGGKALHKRFVAKETGIPWFVFLSADGAPIITSDGPKGNVGFPAAPEEIEHFIAMVTKTKKSITDTDVQLLKKSLESQSK